MGCGLGEKSPSGLPCKIHIRTLIHTVYGQQGLSTTLFLPPTSTSSSAQSLNPVAVVTLPLYTIAWWLHNVFLPVQFVAHTTAEWAGSTLRHPPTLRSVLMKSLASPGSFHTESYRTAESLRACGWCPAAKAMSFWLLCHWLNRIRKWLVWCSHLNLMGRNLCGKCAWNGWKRVKQYGITLKVSDWIRIDTHHSAGIGQMLKEDCNLLLRRTNICNSRTNIKIRILMLHFWNTLIIYYVNPTRHTATFSNTDNEKQ